MKITIFMKNLIHKLQEYFKIFLNKKLFFKKSTQLNFFFF